MRNEPDFETWLDDLVDSRGLRKRVDDLVEEMEIEHQLAKLREERGLSQRALAERVGVSQPVIARIESGAVKNIQLRTLVRTAEALGARVRISIEKVPRRMAARRRTRRQATGR